VSIFTELLKGKNNRHIVLDILRRSERPATTAEIAEKFPSEADLGSEASRLESALTSRFSATLNGLVKQGLVRQAGTAEDDQRAFRTGSRQQAAIAGPCGNPEPHRQGDHQCRVSSSG
jgi:hypothetical protein